MKTRSPPAENGGADPLLIFSLIVVAGVLLLLPQTASADPSFSPDTDVVISCDLPGQVIEAGESATFDLKILDQGEESSRKNRVMWYESTGVDRYDWKARFMDGDAEINRIALPTNGSRTVRLVVDTGSETPAGDYAVKIHVGDGVYWVYITISATHRGEKGTLSLTVVDKDGDKIKGAQVAVIRTTDQVSIDQVMSTADGKVSTDLDPGKYTLRIGRSGYSDVEKKGIVVKGGNTTDAGTVMLEKNQFAAEITLTSPVITATADTKPRYDLTVRNIGKSDDTFRLGSDTLPQDWYVRYEEKAVPGTDISEIFIKSGEEKAIVVEAIPPHNVSVGDYQIPIVIDSSATSYPENLTAKIKGSYDLKVYADQYQYPVNRGDSLTFSIRLTNTGNAGTLTNVSTVISAPDGWNAEVSPRTIAGIPPGESATVELRIVPPGNIVASEYKVSVKVTSDQTEKSDDFRIVVHEQSLIAVFGVALLLLVGGGVYYMFRRYSRR